jgi:putative Mg2+ transporter-C (MgtC) family protein
MTRRAGPLIGARLLESLSNLEILERVVISIVAGAIIGAEREWQSKPAGIRTYALVCEGSALFMIAGLLLNAEISKAGGISDPSRIASTVVQGVGFIAGGVIFTQRARVQGITTAAGIWVTAAIGLAIGAGFYTAAIIGVLATLFTLLPLNWVERGVSKSDRTPRDGEDSYSD